jgi:hypothetical protein
VHDLALAPILAAQEHEMALADFHTALQLGCGTPSFVDFICA